MESCANCGEAIGNLEQAFVFDDRVVCPTCHKKLASPAATPAIIGYATDSSQGVTGPSPFRPTQTIELTGKGWKLAIVIGVLVTLSGLLCMIYGPTLPGQIGIVVGVLIVIAAKTGAWWQHG